jgi:hypothetical protein
LAVLRTASEAEFLVRHGGTIGLSLIRLLA